MDDKLKDIFSNINDWLKFAEAKSATLIAGNAALIFGLFRVYSSLDVEGCQEVYLFFCMGLCSLSLAICLLSVIPALSMPWDSKPNGVQDDDNVLYFSDIAKYTPVAYLTKLSNKVDLENVVFTGYQKDLASQIIINSVISNRKYNYFKVALWLTLSAIVSPLVTILIYILRSK